jgi:hypothetical protein
MRFRRTPKGLSNQHLFYDVDAVVFVEGGTESYSKEEVYEGHFTSSAIDIQFWRGIFRSFFPMRTFQFKAIGSKVTLDSIAEDVVNGTVKNVFVAMDRDHDTFNKKTKTCKGIVYTYGYSWENDVWDNNVVEDVFRSVCVVCDISQLGHVRLEIDKLMADFSKKISGGVCADVTLSVKGKSFFPRDKPESCIRIARNGRPSVNIAVLQRLFREKQIDDRGIKRISKQVNTLRDCYGHLLSTFCYRTVLYLIGKWGKLPKIAKHYVSCLAIDKFLVKFPSAPCAEVHSFYERQFRGFFC